MLVLCWPHFFFFFFCSMNWRGGKILTYCTFKHKATDQLVWSPAFVSGRRSTGLCFSKCQFHFFQTGCCVVSFVAVVFLCMATPVVVHSCSLNTQPTLKMDGRFGALMPDFVWMRPLGNVVANGKCHLFGKPLFINHSMIPSTASMAKNHNQ